MKISEIFNLNRSQYELDFVDIDIDKDLPLFLDPYYISKMEFPFAVSAYSTLNNFFEYLLVLLRQNYMKEAREIFSYLGETNEICLGMSKGIPSGKGMGPADTERIFESLLKSKAYRTGLMEDIEDFRIFVPNIDKDKVSDMTTNIIKKHLIEYTQEQCKIWDIPLTSGVPSGYFWNPRLKIWDNEYTDMLIYDNRKIILVPKRIVSFSKKYTSEQYMQHFVLYFLQDEHLRLQSNLVKFRKDQTPYVTKVSIKESLPKVDKEWLANFTLNHPEVFRDFKKDTIKKIKEVENYELTNEDLTTITTHLIRKLENLPTGANHATEYHKTVLGVLELLFYPYLCNPRIEKEIHSGRKRIDITFDNCAESGFFYRLPNIHQIPSSIIMIECKNYTQDLKNPELDQMAGRFGPNRGKFGIITCRKIENMELYIKRCQDTHKDDRGLIIPLVDDDLIKMLEDFPQKLEQSWENILQDKLHQVKID